VGRLLLIDAVVAAILLGVWYLLFRRFNHRKGTDVLRWVQAACAGKGRIVEAHWRNSSLLLASLHLPSRWFEDARLTVRLLPRPFPMHWMLGRWRKQSETLTFEADLGCAPGFRLDVLHHRWSGQNARIPKNKKQEWIISKPGPVVLTTRERWAHELNPVVNTLLTSRDKNFLSVRFASESPHFSATVDLQKLSDPHDAQQLLVGLLELAESASAKQL
jgi:hypothetical protein